MDRWDTLIFVLLIAAMFVPAWFFKKLKDVIEDGVRDGIMAAETEKERERKTAKQISDL